MAHKIFVDTGAFFARFYRRDQYHNDVVLIWNHLENESVINCLSFSVMERLKIKQAFTFEKTHFGYVGFDILSPSNS